MKLLFLLIALAFVVTAQETLSNDSIVRMVKAELGEGLIVSMVQNQPGKYSLTPEDLVKLKQEGVSEKILTAMVGKGAGDSAATTGTAAPAEGDIHRASISAFTTRRQASGRRCFRRSLIGRPEAS
jgi:hypothetical protein